MTEEKQNLNRFKHIVVKRGKTNACIPMSTKYLDMEFYVLTPEELELIINGKVE